MRVPYPQNRQWKGIFPGEFLGNLWLTKNIDLSRNTGKVVLGEAFSDIFDNVDDADLTTPVAFVRTAADTTDRWWVLGGKLFKTTNTDPETGWTQDAIGSSPSAPLYDMIEFASALLVATSTNIDRLSAGTWTNTWWSGLAGAAALTSNPHRFCIFSGAVLVTDGRFINDYDGTTARDPALTLPTQFVSQWLKSTGDFVVIGTKSLSGAEAEIFFWDRASSTYNARYGIGDTEALCGFVVAGIPYVVTKKGEIKRFTGQGFDTVQQFPTVELFKNITDINPNGVVVENHIAKMNVNFGASADMRVLSGIWTFDTDTNNLYHSGSVRNDSGKDYSQQEVSAVGAMVATSPTQGRYLVGAKAYTAYSGSTVDAIFSSDETATAGARGYIITPKIPAANVDRFWRELYAKFKNFTNSSDRIRVLYRIIESTTLPAYETITWVNGTSFTGTNANVAVGDFVEIIAGNNAGALAKISTITSGSPNTYTIDLTLNANTSTSRARYLNFKDLGTIQTQGINHQVLTVAKKSNWVQFLIELRGTVTSPELEELLLDADEEKF